MSDYGGKSLYGVKMITVSKAGLEDLERRLAAAEDALRELVAVQNGPPLLKYSADWHAAMDKAERALAQEQQA